MTTKSIQDWLSQVGSKTLFIEIGNSWENGYCERYNDKFRDELLTGEIFYRLIGARIAIEG